jgi:hypothetical protein
MREITNETVGGVVRIVLEFPNDDRIEIPADPAVGVAAECDWAECAAFFLRRTRFRDCDLGIESWTGKGSSSFSRSR